MKAGESGLSSNGYEGLQHIYKYIRWMDGWMILLIILNMIAYQKIQSMWCSTAWDPPAKEEEEL